MTDANWGKPASPTLEQAINEANVAENENQTEDSPNMIKRQQQEARRHLKLNCLTLACDYFKDKSHVEIVEAAKAFYEYAR